MLRSQFFLYLCLTASVLQKQILLRMQISIFLLNPLSTNYNINPSEPKFQVLLSISYKDYVKIKLSKLTVQIFNKINGQLL